MWNIAVCPISPNPMSLALFWGSLSLPQFTGHFPQLPFYFLEGAHQCISCTIHLDPQKSSYSLEWELYRNIFRSLELLSRLHQCNHRLRKYQFPSGKILILFLRKSYSFLYQSLNCQLYNWPQSCPNMQPSRCSDVKISQDAINN